MKYEVITLDNDKYLDDLIRLSKLWVEENCSHGIVENTKEDIKEPIIVAIDNDNVIGYIFGHYYVQDKKTSYIDIDSKCFEIDELYVVKEYRNKGIGKQLYKQLYDIVNRECDYITLATSTKDYKKILHFYVDELDMDFHSAFLIKKV